MDDAAVAKGPAGLRVRPAAGPCECVLAMQVCTTLYVMSL